MLKKFTGKVFITGGAGTLGQAIAERVRADGDTAQLTIYSRDPLKHQAMRRKYPEHTYITGDILDTRALTLAVAGHDLIIHAAAQKHIPEAEAAPGDCYRVNVDGTLNVMQAAISANVPQMLAISTDKACRPISTYGCSKLMMERALQQAANKAGLRINLCRYGNVLGSNGSVLRVWAQQRERGKIPTITHEGMTRFWISEAQAVDLILYALSEPSGSITIPRLPALSMLDLLRYVHGDMARHTVTGIRPGEKLHEELVTRYEMPYVMRTPDSEYMRLYPVTGVANSDVAEQGYTSDIARTLTRDELAAML